MDEFKLSRLEVMNPDGEWTEIKLGDGCTARIEGPDRPEYDYLRSEEFGRKLDGLMRDYVRRGVLYNDWRILVGEENGFVPEGKAVRFPRSYGVTWKGNLVDSDWLERYLEEHPLDNTHPLKVPVTRTDLPKTPMVRHRTSRTNPDWLEPYFDDWNKDDVR